MFDVHNVMLFSLLSLPQGDLVTCQGGMRNPFMLGDSGVSIGCYLWRGVGINNAGLRGKTGQSGGRSFDGLK